MRGPELDRQRERERFDPVAEGARYRLPPELSLAIWERVCVNATDAAGRRDLAQAQQRFHDIAARIAARAGRLRPDVGKLTRAGAESDGGFDRAFHADELTIPTPGRQTLVTAEVHRWSMSHAAIHTPGRRTLGTAEAQRWPTDHDRQGVTTDGAAPAQDPHELPGVAEVARAMAALQSAPRPSPSPSPPGLPRPPKDLQLDHDPADGFPPVRDGRSRDNALPAATLDHMERTFDRRFDAEAPRALDPPLGNRIDSIFGSHLMGSRYYAKDPGLRLEEAPSAPALAPPPRPRTSRFDDFLALGLQHVLHAAMAHGGQLLFQATLGAADPDVARLALPLVRAPRLHRNPSGRAMWRVAERHAATLYRRAVDSGEIEHDSPEVEAALQHCGAGQPLPDGVRRTMEALLGVRLERVRLHTDRVAAEAARAVNAEAFTVGEDIFFANSAYAPESQDGQRLLIHELTHVVQAWQGRTGSTGRVSKPGDALEREAEDAADQVGRGEPARRSQPPTVAPNPASALTSSMQPLFRRAARPGAKPSASQPELRSGAQRTAPNAAQRSGMHDASSDFLRHASQTATQATSKLRHGLAEARANPPGKRALEHGQRDAHRAQAHEHAARATERKQNAKAKARASHTLEAHESRGDKHETIDVHSPIKFKPITEWSKHMPQPLPDQDERERRRIEKLVKTKVEGERRSAKQALEKLRAAHLQKAREVRAMKPRLLAQITSAQKKALARVTASESSQCGAVQRHVAAMQGQVRGHAVAMKGEVISAHATAIAKIDATHDAANRELTQHRTKAETEADTAKSLAIVALWAQFDHLQARFTKLGLTKAGDAIAVGEDEAGLMAGRWDGDKLEAAQKAARDTADGFATSMPEQTAQKFAEIEAKRPGAERDLQHLAKVARDHVKHTYDSGKRSIDAARRSSIHAARAARSAAISQIDQACSSTVASLAAQGASQAAGIRKQAQAARVGIIRTGAAGRASVARTCERAATGIERGVVGLIRGARQVEAPDPEETRRQVRRGAQALEHGSSAAAKGLAQTATGTARTLAKQASGAAEGMASTAAAARATATQIGNGAKQQMSAIAHESSQGFHQIAEAHKAATHAAVHTAKSGFTSQVKALHTSYHNAWENRKTEFDSNYDQCKGGLDSAVPDRGGGSGGGGSGKKADDGGTSGGGAPKGEIASIQENAQKAADAVKPWWQKALAVAVSVVVSIAVTIAVTALLGPAGVILAGAVAGALSSVAGTMAQNLVLGNGVFDGITVKSVLMGAAAGALGAGLTESMSAGAKALAGAARVEGTALGRGASAVETALGEGEKTLGQRALKTGLETATDTVGDQATNLIFDGKLDVSAEDLVMSAVTNAATGHKKFEAFQQGIHNRIAAPFHLKLPALQSETGHPPSPPGGGTAHGDGGPAHSSGPAPATAHGNATGHGTTSTTDSGGGGGHTAPRTGGDHAGTPPSSGGGAGSNLRGDPPSARLPHGDLATTKPQGDATIAKPHGDAAPAKSHGDTGPAKPPRDHTDPGQPPRGEASHRSPPGDSTKAPHGDTHPARAPRDGADRSSDLHGDTDSTGSPHGNNDPAKAQHGDTSPSSAPHSDTGPARSPHGDAGSQAPHRIAGGHDGSPHVGADGTGSHPSDGRPGAEDLSSEATTALDSELADLGYPAGTHAKGDELAGQIEQGGTPRKDSLRDTEANQHGLRELQQLERDAHLTPEQNTKLGRDLAARLREQVDPTGDLTRDIKETRARTKDSDAAKDSGSDNSKKGVPTGIDDSHRIHHGDAGGRDASLGPAGQPTDTGDASTAPKTDPVAAAPITLTGEGDKLGNAAQWVKPEPGKLDVVVHGSSDSFHLLRDGQWIAFDHRSLAQYIKKSGGKGQDIRLISCGTGHGTGDIAQHLANKLGVKIIAPSDTVWIHPDGTLTVGRSPTSSTGKWNSYSPGVKIDPIAVASATHKSNDSASAGRAAPHETESVAAAPSDSQNSHSRFTNFRDKVTPKEIRGAPPVEGSNTAGHARSKHGVKPEEITAIVNEPERIFTGVNTNGREVDIYYKQSSVVITEAGNKRSVITAYGTISKRSPSPVDPDKKWSSDPQYVEIRLNDSNEIIFPNRERWERGDWP